MEDKNIKTYKLKFQKKTLSFEFIEETLFNPIFNPLLLYMNVCVSVAVLFTGEIEHALSQ